MVRGVVLGAMLVIVVQIAEDIPGDYPELAPSKERTFVILYQHAHNWISPRQGI